MLFFSSLFAKPETDAVIRPKTVLDMVTYAAGLVSNSRDIDPLLDKVRLITSKLQPGQTPSPNENKELVTVYLQIEHYLTTKEPLRTFVRDELRARLDPHLRTMITSFETQQ
jgi:hypothetical protein